MKIGKLAFSYIIMMPYLILLVILFPAFFDYEVTGAVAVATVVIICMLCSLAVAACVLYNIWVLLSLSDHEAAEKNLLIRGSHIPAHFFMLVLLSGFLNPFLLLLSWIPVAVDISLLVFDACTNICSCINLFRRKRVSFGKAFLLAFLSYIYVGGFVSAFIQSHIAKKSPD